MCLNCKPVIPLTEKAKNYRKYLVILFFVDIVIMILKIIFQIFSVDFSILIELLILSLTIIICHYIFCAFLIFLTFFDLFSTIYFLSLRMQNKFLKLEDEIINKHEMAIIVQIIYFIFCIILIIFTFFAYREFKAISYGELNYEPLNAEINVNHNNNNNNNNINVGIPVGNNNNNFDTFNNNNNSNSFVPFSGRGYVVGGN